MASHVAKNNSALRDSTLPICHSAASPFVARQPAVITKWLRLRAKPLYRRTRLRHVTFGNLSVKICGALPRPVRLNSALTLNCGRQPKLPKRQTILRPAAPLVGRYVSPTPRRMTTANVATPPCHLTFATMATKLSRPQDVQQGFLAHLKCRLQAVPPTRSQIFSHER